MTQQNSLQCDVLVVGGGVAGIAAAVGASRAGARVILVEKYGFLGGMATAGMVSTVCGAFLRNQSDAHFVANGFVKEFVAGLADQAKASPVSLPNGLHILPYSPWHMVRLADEYVQRNSVHLLLHSTIQSVANKNGSVARVICQTWNATQPIDPVCVVDCTGEAILVEQAGGERVQESEQLPSVLFRLDGLQVDTQGERVALLRKVIQAAEKDVIHDDCRNISFVPGHAGGMSSLFSIPMTGQKWSGGDVTGLELHGRQLIDDVMRIFVHESMVSPSVLPLPAMQVGIRTGSLAKGRSMLTVDHVLHCKKDDQGVARGCWPIEMWRDGRKPEVTYLPERDYYDIPAGCLVAKDLSNVFMGGRCISAEEKAMGSARVIGTAIGTGFGAGTIAAFQALGKDQQEATTYLQEQQN